MATKDYILNLLQKHKTDFTALGVSNIGLFGSYLHNRQTSQSDIDLLLDFYPEQETFDNYMAVYDLIERLFEHHRVEIVTKNGLSRHIGPAILKDVVYA